MEYKNKTEQNVYDQIVNSDLRVCQKVKDVMLLSFQKTKYGNYAVFYNDICLGMFMSKDFVDPNELKECGWIIKPGIFGANVIKG